MAVVRLRQKTLKQIFFSLDGTHMIDFFIAPVLSSNTHVHLIKAPEL